MKTSFSYTSTLKFAVINEWNRSHNMTKARAAANNVPAMVTCYKWVQACCKPDQETFTRHSNAVKKRAVRMYYSKGRKLKPVAQKFNVSTNTVYRWVKATTV